MYVCVTWGALYVGCIFDMRNVLGLANVFTMQTFSLHCLSGKQAGVWLCQSFHFTQVGACLLDSLKLSKSNMQRQHPKSEGVRAVIVGDMQLVQTAVGANLSRTK